MKRERAKLADDAIPSSLRVTNSDLLPNDLMMEIFIRLPIKTLGILICVSKLWASIIRSPNFMKLFLNESSNRPGRLFFTFKPPGKVCTFYSSPQTQNPSEASVATYHKPHPVYDHLINSSSVHGLICYETACASGFVVYNSITRRSITLSKFEDKSCYFIKHFLGYDPIDGVYKVMYLTKPAERKPVSYVLTLGNENPWRMIEVNHSHFPINTQICVSGVVYYEARVDTTDTECKEAVVMSFDVRSEKFDLIKRPDDAHSLTDCSAMIRYKGKLALMSRLIPDDGSIALWVLDDHQAWLKKVFVLPDSWISLAWGKVRSAYGYHRFVNVSDSGELILAPSFLRLPVPGYYVLYYDPERNSVRKVEIEGLRDDNNKLLRCTERECFFVYYLFSSQGESLMFL